MFQLYRFLRVRSVSAQKGTRYLFIFNLSFLIFNFACGGAVPEPTGISFSETKGDTGYVQLSVTDSKSPPSLSKIGKITQYKVILDGEGLDPLEQIVSQDANGAVLEGIPIGKNRRIQVFALNVDNRVLREGAAENVAIEPDVVTSVSIELESVPIVLNVAEGTSLSNQRLHLHILTDPNHSVAVEEERLLTDIATSLSRVGSNEKGELKFYPGVLPAGDHHFVVKDSDSGKSSSLTIHLWDGDGIKGAPLFAASQSVVPKRLGQSLASVSTPAQTGGDFFPNIAEALWKTR